MRYLTNGIIAYAVVVKMSKVKVTGLQSAKDIEGDLLCLICCVCVVFTKVQRSKTDVQLAA